MLGGVRLSQGADDDRQAGSTARPQRVTHQGQHRTGVHEQAGSTARPQRVRITDGP